ncbi:MAG: hypothetical protein EXS33_00060 [Pedosphaera sp.]|nr:hypothetical protein [Pedosphaera sp.]
MHLIPGGGRVYVKVGAAFDYARWIEAYRAGRSFATNGPLLRFTAGGREPGDEIVAAGPLEIDVVGEAQSHVPMEALEIGVNGEIVHRQQTGVNTLSIRIAKKVWLERSGWVALRAKGPGHRLAPNDREVIANTSPVYYTQGGRKPASRVDRSFFRADRRAISPRWSPVASLPGASSAIRAVLAFILLLRIDGSPAREKSAGTSN